MLLLSTSANQYSASGCARPRRKRAGDEPAPRPDPCRDGNVRLKRGDSKGCLDHRLKNTYYAPAVLKSQTLQTSTWAFSHFFTCQAFWRQCRIRTFSMDAQCLFLLPVLRGDKRRLTTTQPIIDQHSHGSDQTCEFNPNTTVTVLFYLPL